jgi:hypothetical protein
MSVGLLVVRFQYGLYVVVHLSKFVSLFYVFTRLMSTVSCVLRLLPMWGYTTAEAFSEDGSVAFVRRRLLF